MSSALVIYSLWLCGVSGCIGCAVGMGLMLWRVRQIRPQTEATSQLQNDLLPTTSPGRDEIKALLGSLLKINSEVDARVGQHTIRIEEINQTLENKSPDNGELLVRAAELLVAANQQLQTDLAVAKSELEDQRELVDCFKYESRTDALTQLSNRRAFDAAVNDHLEKFNSENAIFSLLLIDIDHFKRINDEHGHLNGDQVLATVAHCLKTSLTIPASVSRYGGEEFAVILPGVTGKNAVKIAEHLRRSVECCPHEICGAEMTVTVSVGVTEAVEGDTRSDIIERSDQALFAAKNAGRNRCFHDLPKGRSQNLQPVTCVG